MNEVYLLSIESAPASAVQSIETIISKEIIKEGLCHEDDTEGCKTSNGYRQKMLEIEEHIDQVKKYRNAIIADLQNKKRLLKCISEPYQTVIQEDQLDKLISALAREHENIIEQLVDKSKIVKLAPTYTNLNVILGELDGEIIKIQDEYSATLQRLDNSQKDAYNVMTHVESLDKMLQLVETEMAFTEKRYDIIRAKMEDERSELLQRRDLHQSELCLRLTLLDKELENISEECIEIISTLAMQKNDMQSQSNETLLDLLISKDLSISLNGELIKTDPVSGKHIVLQWTAATEIGMFKGVEDMMAKLMFSIYLRNNDLLLTKEDKILTKSGTTCTIREAYEAGLLEFVDMGLFLYIEEVVDKRRRIFATKTLDNQTSDTKSTTSTPSDTMKNVKQLEDNSAIEIDNKSKKSVTTQEETNNEPECVPVISYDDCNYLKQALGKPLALALGEITNRLPTDPIHYLAHWLFKYRYNKSSVRTEKLVEVNKYSETRHRFDVEKEKEKTEENSKNIVLDMIFKAEIEATNRELRRQLGLPLDEGRQRRTKKRSKQRRTSFKETGPEEVEKLTTEDFIESVTLELVTKAEDESEETKICSSLDEKEAIDSETSIVHVLEANITKNTAKIENRHKKNVEEMAKNVILEALVNAEKTVARKAAAKRDILGNKDYVAVHEAELIATAEPITDDSQQQEEIKVIDGSSLVNQESEDMEIAREIVMEMLDNKAMEQGAQ